MFFSFAAPHLQLFRCQLVGVGLVYKFFPFLISSSFMLCVVLLTARLVYLHSTLTSFSYPRSSNAIYCMIGVETSYCGSLFSLLSTQGIKILLSFILILRCCLLAIKEAVLFFSCFWKFLVFPCVPVLPCLGCGCLTPFMPLSGCLRLAILVGFPRSPS